MVFSSAAFLFAFFPVYIAVVALVRNIKACNVLLTIMSLLFYAWGEPVYILLMLLSITVNYLIALPAEKYREGDSIKRRTLLSLAVIYNLTALGLFKYAGFLVSTLNSVAGIVDQIYALESADINIALAWTAGILYSLQIYFDFSGYSDMAIGLGKMAGFTFLENFNYPYTSFSVREFWKRWHISLTTWFREYVYFPLGGNRKGELRTGVNRMSVFLLTGMWHGAMWTFVVWGVFHGIFQLLETYLIHPDKWKKPLAYLYAMAVVVAGFAIFRADSMGQAVNILWKMVAGFRFTDVGLITLRGLVTFYNAVIVAAAFVAMTPIVKDTADSLAAKYNARQAVTCMKYAVSVFLMALCMMSIASSSYNPFIYFRF